MPQRTFSVWRGLIQEDGWGKNNLLLLPLWSIAFNCVVLSQRISFRCTFLRQHNFLEFCWWSPRFMSDSCGWNAFQTQFFSSFGEFLMLNLQNENSATKLFHSKAYGVIWVASFAYTDLRLHRSWQPVAKSSKIYECWDDGLCNKLHKIRSCAKRQKKVLKLFRTRAGMKECTNEPRFYICWRYYGRN